MAVVCMTKLLILLSVASSATIALTAGSADGYRPGSCSVNSSLACDPNTNCTDSTDGKSFTCKCLNDSQGDGFKAEVQGSGCSERTHEDADTRLCSKDLDCHQYAVCNLTSFKCVCQTGFQGDGYNCSDINECADGTAKCVENAVCRNFPGGYNCTCDDTRNYVWVANACVLFCYSDNNCDVPRARCNASNSCECIPGYEGNGVNCTDIDECANGDTNNCSLGADCINTNGSFKCLCKNGYSGDGCNCTLMPQTCDDIKDFSPGQLYKVDPDGTGPAKVVKVTCEQINDTIVTVVTPTNSFPIAAPKDDTPLTIGYDSDPSDVNTLARRSEYCHQTIKFSCYPGFRLFPGTSWCGASGKWMETFGSYSYRKCACGAVQSCSSSCYCDGNQTAAMVTDSGRIMDKPNLPVRFMRFNQQLEHKGLVTLGPLMCAYNSIDTPRCCHEGKYKFAINSNGPVYIDPDGHGGKEPFLTKCDMQTYPNAGVTEIAPQSDVATLTESQGVVDVKYDVGLPAVEALIYQSVHCSQYLELKCTNTGITSKGASVIVTSSKQRLINFPGGHELWDSCGCGSTHSCEEPQVKCNCDITDGRPRKDFGYITNKQHLPIVAVAAVVGANGSAVFKIGPLQCSQKQFGIRPNCESYRANGALDSYTYPVDPDGPGGVEPFNAECRMSTTPPKGVTVVHHNKENSEAVGNDTMEPMYTGVSPAQLEALKNRSTACTQTITFSCYRFSIQPSQGALTWTGADGNQYDLLEYLSSCGPAHDKCQCRQSERQSSDSGTITDLQKLPVYKINFTAVLGPKKKGKLFVTLGPLICTQVFETCAIMKEQLSGARAVEGEGPLPNGDYTIDPDGVGGVAEFSVRCQFPTTVVPIDNPIGGLTPDPGGAGVTSSCFDINYTDRHGNSVAAAQVSALVQKSRRCKQDAFLECVNARISGRVNYTTCDGKSHQGFVGGYGEGKCPCGVNGNCAGGRDAACNCDLEDNTMRSDSGSVLKGDQPLQRICLAVNPSDPSGGSSAITPEQKFKVSELRCDTDLGAKKNCQVARQKAGPAVKSDQETPVTISTDVPLLVGCRFYVNPQIGILVLKVVQPVNSPDKQGKGQMSVDYITHDFKRATDTFKDYTYCIQCIFIFNVSAESLEIRGKWGFYNADGKKLVDVREVNETSTCFQKAKDDYSELFGKYGLPKVFTLNNKEELPVTRIVMTGSGIVIAVGDCQCVDLKKTCQDMLDTNCMSTGHISGDHFIIDPDGSGEINPFPAKCVFDKENGNAVTLVLTDKPGQTFTVAGKKKPASFTQPVKYLFATYQQINALTQVSENCWQGVFYQSRYSPIDGGTNPPSSYYSLYGYGPSPSFGTGSDVSTPGCACSRTGTCVSEQRCNSDALWPLAFDQGVVTDKSKLPIISVTVGDQRKPNSMAKIQITGVHCSSYSYEFLRDCSELYKMGQMFGFTSNFSGECPLSPEPRNVPWFFAWCEYDPHTNSGVAVIKVSDPVVMHLDKTDNPSENITYLGVATIDQLKALVRRSAYCYQGIIYECLDIGHSDTSTLQGGPESHTPLHFWGNITSGLRKGCPCGEDGNCGGLDSWRKQKIRRCNCDVGDGTIRADAGIITNKEYLPLEKVAIPKDAPYQQAIVTVGDLYCSQKPVHTMNPCALGFHDCHSKAKCIRQGTSYRCSCEEGWTGKGVVVDTKQARANGRECIDDNECAGLNSCPHTANCVNTPGSYRCTCKSGYLQTGPTSCQDINECADLTLSDCNINAQCENLEGSYRCICNRGFHGDGRNCTPVGKCLCFGGSHCISYDGHWVDVQGVNEFVLTQDGCSPGQPQSVRIQILTWKRNGTWPGYYSYIKAVIIYSAKVIRLDQGGQIIVDGSVVRNYKEKNLLTVRKVKGNVELKTVYGLILLWDGKDIVQVLIPNTFSNSLCGICGNYNGKPEDDTKCGPGCPPTAGNLTKSGALFSESWVVGDSSDSINCDPDQPERVDGLCFNPRRFVEAEINELFNSKTTPFKKCLKNKTRSHMKKLGDRFEYDLCHVESDLDKEVCRLAERMAWGCRENEKIDVSGWASRIRACEEKPRCPNNMVHRTSKNAALPVRTCDYDNGTEEVDENRECFCQQGQVLEDDRCIAPEKCGCFYNNGYMATGDVTTEADCSKIECKGKNTTSKIRPELQKNEECVLVKGLVVIRCQKGYIKDNNTCIRDKCYEVKCIKANMVCVNGTCACKTGYIYECDQCKDIDECATGIANCANSYQTCVNTAGSFACTCQLGYKRNGQNCQDINECDYAVSSCGANSECVNEPGTYRCECCSGYTKNQNGTCQRDDSTGQVTKKCCACHGRKCEEYGAVCGTDGRTYPSHKSLYVAACRANDEQLKVNYKGSCKEKCQQVDCDRQYASCEVVNAVPQCKCPTCRNSTNTRQAQMFCASNGITYSSRCHMEAAVCAAGLKTKVKVETVGKPCLPKSELKETSWGPWSECSERCKPGVKTRSRTAYSNITQSYVTVTESETCYSTCARGPCFPRTCKGAGQVCVVTENNTATCQCPTCADTKEESICGQCGVTVQTFPNECYLRKKACETSELLYEVLERRACEMRPAYCDVVRNFEVYTDENGCKSGSINFGKCDGGCDNVKSQCCIATEFAKKSVFLDCPSGTVINKELSVITKCGCRDSPSAVRNDL